MTPMPLSDWLRWLMKTKGGRQQLIHLLVEAFDTKQPLYESAVGVAFRRYRGEEFMSSLLALAPEQRQILGDLANSGRAALADLVAEQWQLGKPFGRRVAGWQRRIRAGNKLVDERQLVL